ncbi:MAG: site-specific integrase [bacterium]|nr:site-specific integrase [bacterium]
MPNLFAFPPDSDPFPDALSRAGDAANHAAARHVFAEYQARRAPHTLRRHAGDLALLAEFLGAVGAPVGDLLHKPDAWRGITWGLVSAWVAWMLQRGYAVTTVNARLSTVKLYAKLAAQAGALTPEAYALIRTVSGYTHAEIAHVDAARAAADLPTRMGSKKAESIVLTLSQVKALKRQPDTPQGRRDALLVCLMFDHGLRVGEIARLEVGAISLDVKTLTFYRPKVDAVQTHALTPSTMRAARAYLENDAPAEGRLLRASLKSGQLTKTGMNERAITKRLNTLAKRIGVTGVSAHDGRHTWATRAARNHTDLFALQEAGGWNSLEMPRRYVEKHRIANAGVVLDDDEL